MKKLWFIIVLSLLIAAAFWGVSHAVEVPGITPTDFGVPMQAAHPIWAILAGDGFWGALLIGLTGFIYRLARPYILAWMEERKLSRLYLAIEAFAAKTNADYTEGMKKASADGKLTKDEAEFVFRQCKQNLVIFMQSQGVDIIKEYGDAFVDALIEYIVQQIRNPLAKAVAVPLSEPSVSAPLPPSVTEGVRPA